MLNKIKNIVKIYLRNNKIRRLKFQHYSEYKQYFASEDRKSNWDATTFSKIIENNLKGKTNLVLVEVGVARGGTSDFTIKKLSKNIAKYTGVDPYKSNYDKTDIFSYYNQEFMDNCYLYVIEKVNDSRFDLIRTTSKKASSEFQDNSIDAIFIDGDHTYSAVLEDIKCWKNKVKKGGLMIGDDYQSFKGVKKAVHESFSEFHQEGNSWFVIL